MTTPRYLLVDPEHPLCYHLVSGCVRGAFLCGWNKKTRKDYSHRKLWLEQRMFALSRSFAVDIYAHAIMSNHFHVVVRYDPKAYLGWSDEEVAERWLNACPPRVRGRACAADVRERMRQTILRNAKRLDGHRKWLGSLSSFMKHLKQPISARANHDDNVAGHFFEKRFYSGVLLDESSTLAAMAYVDLNPVRANIANSIEKCKHTSISKRLKAMKNTPERLEEALAVFDHAPNASAEDGKEEPTNQGRTLSITVGQYIELLRGFVVSHRASKRGMRVPDKQRRWVQQVASMGERQRAYGSFETLEQWLTQRNMRFLEKPLP
jgi:REP element-mobilizing transposase RayT